MFAYFQKAIVQTPPIILNFPPKRWAENDPFLNRFLVIILVFRFDECLFMIDAVLSPHLFSICDAVSLCTLPLGYNKTDRKEYENHISLVS